MLKDIHFESASLSSTIQVMSSFFSFLFLALIIQNPIPRQKQYGMILVFFLKPHTKCILCSFPIRNEAADSTSNDWVLTASIGRINNLVPFIRSLRTTDSQAQCSFLLDQSAYATISLTISRIVSNCGATILTMGNFTNLHPKYLRYIFYYHHI